MSNIPAKPWPGVQFKPGVSGNPAGRPIGVRNAFSAAFIRDLSASWHEHGATVLTHVARKDPSRYLGICSTLIPKDVAISIEQRLPGGLSPDDWMIVTEVMHAVKQAIPDASQRQPGEVLQITLDAIRAHTAQTIEGE